MDELVITSDNYVGGIPSRARPKRRLDRRAKIRLAASVWAAAMLSAVLGTTLRGVRAVVDSCAGPSGLHFDGGFVVTCRAVSGTYDVPMNAQAFVVLFAVLGLIGNGVFTIWHAKARRA